MKERIREKSPRRHSKKGQAPLMCKKVGSRSRALTKGIRGNTEVAEAHHLKKIGTIPKIGANCF